jgi:hypothetical protein
VEETFSVVFLPRTARSPRAGAVEYLYIALPVVGDDEKGTQCLGVKLGNPVPGGYKYKDLAL